MKRRKKKNIMGQKISASRIQAKQVNQGGEVSQNEIMEFLKQNIWNVLGTGAAILPTVAQAIIMFISYRYSQGWYIWVFFYFKRAIYKRETFETIRKNSIFHDDWNLFELYSFRCFCMYG